MLALRTGPDRPAAPPQTIYCDESGVTGNDLLNPNQSYFTYASVALKPERAEEVVRKLLHDFKLQGNELKAKNLVKPGSGRRVVRALIREVRDQAHLVIHHKKYALACKFFEYIFEPVVARYNSIFYEADFHRFIANLLYAWTVTQDKSAEQLLADFAEYMRSLDPARVPAFFGSQSVVLAAQNNPLSHIGTFCMIHRKKIADELDGLQDTTTGKWILDLTNTSLWSILSYWGDRYHQLDVFCDNAAPLQNVPLFDIMVNRQDRAYIKLGNKERLLTFNLAHTPQLVSSVQSCGVQIADVLAGALRYGFEWRDAETQKWLEDLQPCISGESVLPDLDCVDPDTPEAFANSILLHELINRSLKQENLFEGIPELITAARADFPEFERNMGNGQLRS